MLQASIKLTTEPTNGLKHNVLRALQATRGAMEAEGPPPPQVSILYRSVYFIIYTLEGPPPPQQLKAVVFALCVFHAMVCERRKVCKCKV